MANKPDPQKQGAAPTPTEAGAPEVQKKKDAEDAQGFSGVEVDPTPNENYTVEGVTSGKPTPETDKKAAEESGTPRVSKFVRR